MGMHTEEVFRISLQLHTRKRMGNMIEKTAFDREDPCLELMRDYERCVARVAGRPPDEYEEPCQEEVSRYVACRRKWVEDKNGKR